MNKYPKVRVGGYPLDIPRMQADIVGDEPEEERSLELDAARYRFWREHCGMTPEQFDEYIDARIKRWDELSGK